MHASRRAASRRQRIVLGGVTARARRLDRARRRSRSCSGTRRTTARASRGRRRSQRRRSRRSRPTPATALADARAGGRDERDARDASRAPARAPREPDRVRDPRAGRAARVRRRARARVQRRRQPAARAAARRGAPRCGGARTGAPVARRERRPATAAVLGPTRARRRRRADGAAAASRRRGGTLRGARPRPAGVVGVGFAGTTPLALVAGRGRAAVLDVATGRTVPLRGPARLPPTRRLQRRRRAASSRSSRTAPGRVWDARTGRLVMTVPGASTAAISRRRALRRDRAATARRELWSVDTRTRLAGLGDATSTSSSAPTAALVVAVAGNGGRRSCARTHRRAGRDAARLRDGRTRARALLDPLRAGRRVQRGRTAARARGRRRDRARVGARDRKQVGAVGMGWANTLAFAPRGDLLAAMTWDGDVVVARAPGEHRAPHRLPAVELVPGRLRADARQRAGRGSSLRPRAAPASGRVDGVPMQRLPTLARPSAATRLGRRAAFSGDGAVVAAAGNASGLLRDRDSSGSAQACGEPADARRFACLPDHAHVARCSTGAARCSPPTAGPGGLRPGRACGRSTGSSRSSPDGTLALVRAAASDRDRPHRLGRDRARAAGLRPLRTGRRDSRRSHRTAAASSRAG